MCRTFSVLLILKVCWSCPKYELSKWPTTLYELPSCSVVISWSDLYTEIHGFDSRRGARILFHLIVLFNCWCFLCMVILFVLEFLLHQATEQSSDINIVATLLSSFLYWFLGTFVRSFDVHTFARLPSCPSIIHPNSHTFKHFSINRLHLSTTPFSHPSVYLSIILSGFLPPIHW